MRTPTPGLRRVLAPWLAGSILVAVVVLVVVLMAGGGAPELSPGGLPDAGSATGWGLPILRLLVDLAGFATVGLTLIACRMIHVEPAAPEDALPTAGRVAAVWAVLASLQALLLAALAVGLAALAVGTRRALHHSTAMAGGAKGGRPQRR